MLLREIVNNIKHELVRGSLDIEISGISYDSRKVKKGDLFVAIKGFTTDGHKYIESAVQNGAVAVIGQEDSGFCENYIKVKDSREALAQASLNFYQNPQKKLKLIGVTGTNGKTTTTHLIKSILEFNGYKCGLIGTNHNMIGSRELPAEHTTPESLDLAKLLYEMANENVEYVIMEVSSHSLAQKRVHGLYFFVAAFTNLTQDHLDFHASMEEYRDTKAKLFSMCEASTINIDDEAGKYIFDNTSSKKISYGIHENAMLCAKDIRLRERGVIFELSYNNEKETIRVNIPGLFSVYNALCAIGVCLSVGLSLSDIQKGLVIAKSVKGRAEVVPTNTPYTVIIDYAHTPDGLENIINTVRGFAKGRVITLFGCGGDRDRGKRPKMGKIAAELSDYVVVTSDNPRTENPSDIIKDILEGMKGYEKKFTVVENRREAIKYALSIGKEGDVIILAGKGHETYQILKDRTIDFDERQIVKEILEGNQI